MRTRIKQLFSQSADFMGKQITVCGWARTVRDSKTFGFIELNDGSFFKSVQVVFDNNLNNFNEVAKLGAGACVSVVGTLVESPGGKQDFEVKAESIVIEGIAPPEYPLQKKRHTAEYLRTIAHLRPRTNLYSAVFRVRSAASFAIHKFFNERGFVLCHSPLITANDCEGAGEMFRVTTLDPDNLPKNKDGSTDFSKDFFGKPSNLTVSGQLSAETFAMAFGDTYTFGPTFRAENSNTPRHAAEFWMIEPEIAFADLDDDIRLIEDMMKYVVKDILENCPEEFEFFDKFIENGLIDKLKNVIESDFGRITYTEAIKMLEAADEKFEYPVFWGMDMHTECERYLAEKVFKRPVFVTDYPKEIKAFYMRRNDDGKTVAATDLMVPGVGELVGGSQREERLDVLIDAIKANGLKEEDLWWYLDLRRFGGVKHAGFGIGFERLIMYVTGVSNIRDVIPYPRTPNNADF